ncbi:hypothetical protein P171DRAFT_520783 [Karstenula rhodostoma CBS 690.94]|uniref:Uncharacterized protein n=1 Tax=Karstenula rhodostoma CBS 690.94 TaxID=1392251 RepID=A0A9P4PKM5_9PLEO|nr:hypothetical protein P171DRAFT_520783 [Karstenula rhodostoma CBS 690.94]
MRIDKVGAQNISTIAQSIFEILRSGATVVSLSGGGVNAFAKIEGAQKEAGKRPTRLRRQSSPVRGDTQAAAKPNLLVLHLVLRSSASTCSFAPQCANTSIHRTLQSPIYLQTQMNSNSPAHQPAILEKCAVDEEAGTSGISVNNEQKTCDNEDPAPRPTRIMSGWGLAGAWLLSLTTCINFLRLGVETPSNIVPAIRRSNPPIPVIDNTYFIGFCLIVNFCTGIHELVGYIKKDRSIAPILLLCAFGTACISAAFGVTALEVLMIFIPMGLNGAFTAIYFSSRPKAPVSKEISEKISEMV